MFLLLVILMKQLILLDDVKIFIASNPCWMRKYASTDIYMKEKLLIIVIVQLINQSILGCGFIVKQKSLTKHKLLEIMILMTL